MPDSMRSELSTSSWGLNPYTMLLLWCCVKRLLLTIWWNKKGSRILTPLKHCLSECSYLPHFFLDLWMESISQFNSWHVSDYTGERRSFVSVLCVISVIISFLKAVQRPWCNGEHNVNTHSHNIINGSMNLANAINAGHWWSDRIN